MHRSERASDRVNCLTLLRDQLGRRVYPAHRLDRGASGVLLFALGADVARRLQPLLAQGRVVKRYLAVVRGYVAEAGLVERALAPEGGDGAPAPALTAFRRLARAELPHAVGRYDTARYSLVELRPYQGRHHQLRRHLAHLRHPIVGDVTHGDGAHNRFFRERFACRRLLLHAGGLALDHPVTGAALLLRAPPPHDLEDVLGALRFTAAAERAIAAPLESACAPGATAGATRAIEVGDSDGGDEMTAAATFESGGGSAR